MSGCRNIALTCFMNQYDRSCVYQEYHESDCMRLLINEDGGYMRNDGMIISVVITILPDAAAFGTVSVSPLSYETDPHPKENYMKYQSMEGIRL